MNFTRDAVSGHEGFKYLEEILKADSDAVVIFMTAYADTDKAVRAIKAGATDFITKPWDNDKLLVTLKSASTAKSRVTISSQFTVNDNADLKSLSFASIYSSKSLCQFK